MKEFDSIKEAVSYLRSCYPTEALLPGDGCEWVDYSDFLPDSLEWFDFEREFPCGRIMPPQLSPYLYRGQTQRYSTCRPSAFRSLPMVKRPRELSIPQRLKHIVEQVQTCWFTIETRKHPAWDFARKIGLDIHPWALAQHYGIATPFLDMTQSIEVAAFFATCSFNSGQWSPCTSGQGVIYQLNFASVPEAWNLFELVGLSTFPRPGEQKAWVIPLTLDADLEKFPYVETVLFKHSKHGSEHFYELFSKGEALFPHDPAHDLATAIRESKVLPVNCVANALRGLGCPMDQLELYFGKVTDALKSHFQYEVVNEVPVGLNDEQVKILTDYWEKKGKSFLKNVGVRPVAILKSGGQWMRTKEAANLIGCTVKECRKLISKGQLKAIKAFRPGSKMPRYFVLRKSAEAFIETGGTSN